MAKVDFVTLANIIFKDKGKYQFISDEEKESCFFKLFRKFAISNIKVSQFFNNKNVDKASVIDIYYHRFYKTTNGTPDWWWKTNQTKKSKNDIVNADVKLIKDYYELTDNDMKFLTTYYNDKLIVDIKRIKKFKKE